MEQSGTMRFLFYAIILTIKIVSVAR